MLSRRRDSERGLTIIEIAVALGVLALLFTGIFSALATANLAAITARETQAASEEALKRLDQLCAANFDAILGAPPKYFDVEYKTGQLDVNLLPKTTKLIAGPEASFGYQIARGVTGPPAGDSVAAPKACCVQATQISANLMEVRSLVCWKSVDGSVRRVELVSRVTR